MIPFTDLPALYAQIADDLEPEMTQAMRNCQFVGGHFVDRFERNLADYLGVQNVVGVSSGTDAIMLACEGLGVGRGDAVIVPNNAFVACAFAVSRAGAKPLLVDVDPYTYLIDLDQVEEILGAKKRKVKAVLAVDLYGQMPDMERLREMARKYKVYLIEDGSQAMGATFNKLPVGHYANVATTSFHPTKNLGAIGQAGAVITNDTALAKRVRAIANQGREEGHGHTVLGGNYLLDSLAAIHLYHALSKLEKWNEMRRMAARVYNECFNSYQRPTQNPSSRHVYHLYEFCCKNSRERELVENSLAEKKIGYGRHYPHLISDTPMYRTGVKTPIALGLKDVLISLPMFPTLTLRQIEEVVLTVLGACDGARH